MLLILVNQKLPDARFFCNFPSMKYWLPGLFLLAACSLNKESSPQIIDIASPTGTTAIAPYLFTDLSGKVYLSWTEAHSDTSYLFFSKLEGNQWSAPDTIVYGTDWFVNWADYPVIATHNGKDFIAHHLQKSSSDTYSYDILLSNSSDSGKNWQPPFLLHDDGKMAEHGFVSAVPYGNDFLVTWLDGRFATEHQDHNNHESTGAMTLRAAIISRQGVKLEEWELDDRVCDCCQTSAVITDSGPVVAYRDRSENEIRDLYVTRFSEGQWSEPAVVHNDQWKIEGCPVNGPRLSADEKRLGIVWFTAAENTNAVKVSFSSDGGRTFSDPVQVHESSPLGRVDIVLLDENKAIVSWMEGSRIKGAVITEDGTILKRFNLADTEESRSSGFPQMTRHGKQVVVAWRDLESGLIRTSLLNP
jgi:hypothetical protein